MAALRTIAAGIILAMSMPARVETIADWRPYVTEASLRSGVPTEWIERVMRAESNAQTMLNGRPTRSRAGAIGLMQLMPATWEAMRRALRLGNNPDDPHDNILAGSFYLRQLYDRFGYPGLFAAYNAGPARYADHIATGMTLPAETIAYLGKLGATGIALQRQPTASPETLFAIQDRTSPPQASNEPAPPPPSLFMVKHEGP